MLLTSITHQTFDYFLDLDVLSFNALLEATLSVDSSRWMNLSFAMRLAYHAESKDFNKAIKKTWGNTTSSPAPSGDADDFIKRFGKGF